ncbi:putative RNA-directed DNA polymerase [Tanacetum coccineum]|uniref:RNA-directed DNA polymerase n=1 Tax=Tanacetum coccineum TaxID=301880 RepID=A0ABQ5E8Z8_9ASTR
MAQGWEDYKIRYLGGLSILVECPTMDAVNNILSNKDCWVYHWIDSLSQWNEDFTWVSVEGIPVHAWRPEVVHDVLNEFGQVIEVEDMSTEDTLMHKVAALVHTKRMEDIKSGSKMSKLDRFLVSSNFFEHRENASVIAVDRVISDHNPIMLSIGSCDFGPKPFRVFDCWFGHLDFESVVEKSWKSGSYRGTPDIVLKNKIKQLRYDIKEWNIRCSTERHKRRDEILARLCDWDAKAEGGIVTPIDINRREEDRMEIQKIDHLERRIMKQKARIKWAIEGDENSHFFHNYVKKNARKNNIKGLVSNGEWVTNPMSIKDIAFNHFSARFKESCQSRPVFDSNLFRMLNEVDVNFLESEFSKEDIKAAVWDCSGSKAPGPDGLNFKFIKRFWDLIQDDFISCIKHFESSSHLGRGCNPSFISLIPKCKDPIDISDYRPISLIGCVYKIISKLLASRLACVIHKVISPNQTAFLSGRQILDGVVIANEIVNYAKQAGLNLLLFKVDFEKAFDSVNWNFLLYVMEKMGFGVKWRHWIIGCISSASVSVLINGSPSCEFTMERDLRQGDPFSPFLFLIVMETLQVLMLEACNLGIFKGIVVGDEEINVSLLQYADDALIFGEWSPRNVKNLISILKVFGDASGLKVNVSKSNLYSVGSCMAEVDALASLIRCKSGALPFIYLGLPVGKDMSKCASWSNVIERFNNRLSMWKGKLLSIGGRFTLSKAVLGSLPLYYLSVFCAPCKVIDCLERIRSRFFWGFKEGENSLVWVKWKAILADWDRCGLGIRSIKAKKISLIGKWWWRFLSERDALWRKVIAAIHGVDGGFFEGVGAGLKKDVWKSILSCGADRFPRFYALETNKDASLSERWCCFNGVWAGLWSWRINPRGRSESDLEHLISYLQGVELRVGVEDRLLWSLDQHQSFSVKKLTSLIDFNILQAHCFGSKSHTWNLLVPKKVNIHIWRLAKDRLPLLSKLLRLVINFVSVMCPLCGEVPESIDHTMVHCPKVKPIWMKYFSWWDLKPPPGDLLVKSLTDDEDKDMELGGDIFSTIQSCSLLWITHRNYNINADWKSWVVHPLLSFSTNLGT